jgi:hypothetical protein
MTAQPPDDSEAIFDAETARFREILAKGRSATQLALFDLLVERSRDRRSPKEIEIALALFGSVATHDSGANSGARVYVHRLRKRIDEYYLARTGPRLVIPKGEYRIALDRSDRRAQPPGRAARLRQALASNPAVTLGLFLIVGAALAFASWNSWPSASTSTPGVARVRQALLGGSADPFDPLIVVGDSMLLAETQDQRGIQRMILNPAVKTREDFGSYLKAHPESFYQLYDFNLNFAPIGAVEAAWTLQDNPDPRGGEGASSSQMLPASALSPDLLAGRDIIFVGRLSQLRVLEPQVFAQSRFRLAAYDQLIDTANGAVSRGQVYVDGQSTAWTDYGYLSVRTSSTGHRLIVLAGLGNTGAAGVVALLNAPQEIVRLRRKLGAAHHFEALFEVRARSGAPEQRRLIAIHALP